MPTKIDIIDLYRFIDLACRSHSMETDPWGTLCPRLHLCWFAQSAYTHLDPRGTDEHTDGSTHGITDGLAQLYKAGSLQGLDVMHKTGGIWKTFIITNNYYNCKL